MEQQKIQFKKEIPAPGFAGMAMNSSGAGSIIASNRQRKLIIETGEESCLHYSEIPFRILIWGPRNGGKTHFLLTSKDEPICVIDTENRAPLIIPKFRVCKDCGKHWVSMDKHPKVPSKICGINECPFCESKNIRLKDIRRIRVVNSDQAREAAKMFIDILNKYHEKTGKIGTIGVDNISKIWDWVQNEYAASKGLSPEARLSPRDDYKLINPQHNENFREILLQSIHNVVLIATAKPLYGDKEDQYKITAMGAEGQKHNIFAVDWEIYNSEGEVQLKDGKTVGNGIFTSYIIKNSIISGNIAPIQFLDFTKLVTLREKLLVECGVTELPKPETPEPEKIQGE